jgi:hypothetical protein
LNQPELSVPHLSNHHLGLKGRQHLHLHPLVLLLLLHRRRRPFKTNQKDVSRSRRCGKEEAKEDCGFTIVHYARRYSDFRLFAKNENERLTNHRYL